MEKSDEPEQPISLGRQEFRRRRRPSQPMVDKSQQTDVTEKKKSVAVVQPPAPKSTASNGSISGSKGNYSAKEHESLRLSSQLQKTWIKRKHGMEMTDKSLQTETAVEEKVKAVLTDKTRTLEETPDGVRETASALPQSVPVVDIPSCRPLTHLIDRAQQTNCTGDWSQWNICPKDKVDKEQQTYFSELEITILPMPGSSLDKSKEETIPVAQEGSLPEVPLETEVMLTEKVSDAKLAVTAGEFSGEEQDLPAEVLSSEETHFDASLPSVPGAVSDVTNDQQILQGAEVAPSELPTEMVTVTEEMPVEVQNLTTDNVLETSGKVEPATAVESTDGVQPPPSEEASKGVPVEAQSPLDKQAVEEEVSEAIVKIIVEEFPVEEIFEGYQPLTEEAPEDKSTAEDQPLSAEDAPIEVASSEEALVEPQPPPTKEAPTEDIPIEVLPQPTEDTLIEDTSAEVPPPVEEASLEAPPPPPEETPVEVPSPPPEETPEEVPPPPPEETPEEVPPPPPEETPEEVPPPPPEETPEEVPPPPPEETPEEVPPPPPEETPEEVPPPPPEETPEEVPPAPAEETSVEVPPAPAEETPAEVPSPPNEETPTEFQPPFLETDPVEGLPLEEEVVTQ
ncbi:fibrous sheath CABYR-binding protein [Cricetulus griseus]|uniref:fibrous sheath CABYR-binding protein n=1 Tax=Cricetulus griseus TaxID=10029 RepID=UPI0004548A46|nr:fibrous sheath CABYR-binding protein [Cricetulus griseus]